jgi:hypothetical protein
MPDLGGSGWESNPPRPAERPATGFEDRGAHRDPTTPLDYEPADYNRKGSTLPDTNAPPGIPIQRRIARSNI